MKVECGYSTYVLFQAITVNDAVVAASLMRGTRAAVSEIEMMINRSPLDARFFLYTADFL